ncbi:unnamed protein product [Paramecium sonneborni]|uniref:Uncharacterized protein n=1 Tax=Paramecium sonneborni TaxID=65129 RepID=A0A8S1RQC7_9CILI|nr:unnamed protein product [Paramecium sonneborni]
MTFNFLINDKNIANFQYQRKGGFVIDKIIVHPINLKSFCYFLFLYFDEIFNSCYIKIQVNYILRSISVQRNQEYDIDRSRYNYIIYIKNDIKNCTQIFCNNQKRVEEESKKRNIKKNFEITKNQLILMKVLKYK